MLPAAALAATHYAIVETVDGLAEAVTAGRGCVGLRVIGDDPGPMRAGLVGIAFAWGEGHARYVPLGHRALDEVANLEPRRRSAAHRRRFSRTRAWRRSATT